jgi:hypothetical protein
MRLPTTFLLSHHRRHVHFHVRKFSHPLTDLIWGVNSSDQPTTWEQLAETAPPWRRVPTVYVAPPLDK